MLFEKFNPLDGEMFQIMNEEGEIVAPDYQPELEEELLLKMYKTMVFGRVIDTKILQYQRQGRILTYAPNMGQEAAQVGSIATTAEQDWMASAFRELGAWLWKDAPLYENLLYWYGNEAGMHMPEKVKILPVSVPIASQLQHAVGLAYASQYRGLDEVTIGYVGDGGTSQGDFHEALNMAGVMNTPNVFIIQNNQFAISTRRNKQTKAKTLAQKAIAYGIPGIQVDGNDLLAMYVATKEAVDRARNGEGPSLIEAYTYRLGAHTTADDPTVYRKNEEVEEWTQRDPLIRMKKYLIKQELWTEEKEEEYRASCEAEVKETFQKVEDSGLVPLEDVFDHIYEERTPVQEEQYQAIKAFEEKEGK